jgi:DNA-binding transcriptional regulator/RsmH inhibitor MraZ
VYLDQKAEIGASAATAGLRRRRDLWREEEWKTGKREKEKKRNEKGERERISLMKRKEEF